MKALAFPFAMTTPVHLIPVAENERPNVLMVDDDETILDLMTGLLRHQGLGVLSAIDGRQALAIYRECPEQVSAVISDYHMPGMTGLELCVALRDINPDLPAMIISGNLQPPLLDAVRTCHYEVLPKPFTLEQLNNALPKLLPEHYLAIR